MMLAVVAPVFAQPFADVPAEHWAFDAIAELAAKGILEGFPDGTFKGDRAMTRYEMAMALARILARIEAIKIPPPPKIPPPEVTRADVDRLTRLLNEFRAELSALGVRITAVEEELAALRTRVNADTTRITGNWVYAYFTPSADNPDYSGFPELQRNRLRLIVRGQVTGDMTVTARVRWNDRYQQGVRPLTDFDRLIGTWASPWGLTFTVGRDYWALGPQGLLLQLQSASDSGGRITASFGGISLTGLAFWGDTTPGFGGSPAATTYAARAEFAPIAGWTFGLNYRTDRDPSGVFPDPTFGGSGWSVDVQGTLIPGISLLAEYASWDPDIKDSFPTVCTDALFPNANPGCTALFAQLTFDLGALSGMSQFAPTLNVYYKDYKDAYLAVNCPSNAFAPPATFCTNLYELHQGVWLGGDLMLVTAWGADLSLQVTPKLSALVAYEVGKVNNLIGQEGTGSFIQGDEYTAWLARLTYNLSKNADLSLEYSRLNNTTTNVDGVGTSGVAGYIFFSW